MEVGAAGAALVAGPAAKSEQRDSRRFMLKQHRAGDGQWILARYLAARTRAAP